MFETTLTAKPTDSDRRRTAAVTAAVGAHVAVVATLTAISAITVPPVNPPELPPVIYIFVPPSDLLTPRAEPSPPAPTRGVREPERTTSAPVAPKPAQPRVDVAPSRTPDTPAASATPGPETGEIGVPDGDIGGLPDGIPGADGRGGSGTAGTGDPGPVALRSDMVPPVLIKRVEPVYPMAARLSRLPGRVVVQAVVGTDGSVESVEVLSSTSPLFDEAARAAVVQWLYRPASMGGRPVRVYFTVVVSFVIR